MPCVRSITEPLSQLELFQ
uniref:Uncharacterized protein n=1 Tax=Anguilla anguilla TaxID=7936 RepID=A0A0E9QYX8_ANGAN